MKERIKTLARSQKMTIAEVERQAGIGKNTIKSWDRVVPSADKVAAVADVLGTTVEYLLRGAV